MSDFESIRRAMEEEEAFRALAARKKKSKEVELAGRIIRTIITVSLFLLVCKITHFREKMLHDVRINRRFLYLFYTAVLTFICVYTYLLFKLRLLRPRNKRIQVEHWDRAEPIAMYIATGALVMSVLCFIFALWDTFQLMTFVIGFLGFMSVIFVLQWLKF